MTATDILDLTPAMAVRPHASDWHRANALVHRADPDFAGCRCSTCRLAADLGRIIRDQDIGKNR